MNTWKTIENFENLYMVSDAGQVKSLDRIIINKNGQPQRYPEKLLKQDLNVLSNTTYSRVTLCKDNTTKRYLVHRLVAKAFIPNPTNKEHINHIDNNAQNNHYSNLEWCTHSENMIHAQKQGRLFKGQSKGGIAGGLVGTLKLHEKILKIQKTLVGDWLIVSSDYFMRAGKAYIPCKCKCGTTANIELGRLVRKEVTMCKSCAGIVRKLKI